MVLGAFLYTLVEVSVAILAFLVIIIIINKLLTGMEKKGTITNVVKRRIYTISTLVVGVLTALIILHMLYTYTLFLYLFLIIIGVTVASTYPLLNNFYAYFALINTRQLLSGAYVRLGKLKGKVKSIGYIYTQIVLEDESTVYIPNNYLLKRPFTVFKPYGTIRIQVTLMTQAPVNIESLADKIEESIRRGFRHLSPDSEIRVVTVKSTETSVTYEVEVEHTSTELRAKVLNNLLDALYSNLYEFSPSIEIMKD